MAGRGLPRPTAEIQTDLSRIPAFLKIASAETGVIHTLTSVATTAAELA